MERLKVPVAVHLLLFKDDQILLSRRYNTGWNDGNYGVVSGHIDGDETMYEAMKREASEEAGIDILEEDLEIVQVMHRKKTDEERIDYFLICKKYNGTITNTEPNKCDDLSFFDINNLPDNMVEYVKAGIENYMAGIKFSQYGWDAK
jgi:8-oxo-dGTP pyrophosphatase MutT (NUDIX family)